jgi:hypothetical protein
MPIQVRACPSCNRQLSKAAGFYPQYWCSSCKQAFTAKEVEIRSAYKNTNKIRSDKHEKRAAKKLKAKPTLASGALPFDKADVKSKIIRAECKTTQKMSYSIKKELLLKLSRETEQGKIPVFNIQFESEDGDLNYYILDEGWFLQLLELWENECKN